MSVSELKQIISAFVNVCGYWPRWLWRKFVAGYSRELSRETTLLPSDL